MKRTTCMAGGLRVHHLKRFSSRNDGREQLHPLILKYTKVISSNMEKTNNYEGVLNKRINILEFLLHQGMHQQG